MNRRTHAVAWAVAALLAAPLAAEEKAADPAQAEMSPEQKAYMDAMIQAGTPGAEHTWLASLAGSWEFKGKSWIAPDAPVTEFVGTEDRAMILGGRVMQAKVTSAFDGMPFEGIGMSGFDNVTKKWWGTWNDNMSTSAMTTTGSCKDGKCEYQSVAVDPMSGKPMTGRMTSDHMGDQEHHVMYAMGPDGKEFKAMEFHYTRKK
jgi:hypothetical protein